MSNNMNFALNTSMYNQPRQTAFRSLYGAWNNTERKVLPIEEVIKEAKCDYEVSKDTLIKVTPQMVEAIKSGMPIYGLSQKDIITSHCATSRQDTHEALGVVGSDYGVVQNAKAFEFIDFLQKESGAKESIIETAGSLGGGSRIYVTCKLGEDAFLDSHKTDMVNKYVIFTTSHDGSGAVKIYFSPIRVVCQNTLMVSMMRSSEKLTYKHTKGVGERFEDLPKIAAKLMEKVNVFDIEFMKKMQQLASQPVSEDYVKDFAAATYLDKEGMKLFHANGRKLDGIDEISTLAKNKVEKLRQSIEYGIGQDMHRGTKLWLVNGLTTLLHNDTVYKDSEEEFKSLMTGYGFKKLDNAYRFLEAA